MQHSSNIVRKRVKNIHHRYAHDHRTGFLAELYLDIIESMKLPSVRILDIGCGDMRISSLMIDTLEDSSIVGIDTYDSMKDNVPYPNKMEFIRYNGKEFPFENGSFDLGLVSDVLHHAQDQQEDILKEAFRTCKYVIIKDHFEFGFFSKQVLRLMDFVGNWGNGVPIPNSYFTYAQFESLLKKFPGVEEVKRINSIDLYSYNFIFRFFCLPKYQFISVLRINESQ